MSSRMGATASAGASATRYQQPGCRPGKCMPATPRTRAHR
jgi:hypothetical protein